MNEINDNEQIAKLKDENRKLRELLNLLSVEIERRALDDRTPVFLELDHLLIRPEAIQYIEYMGGQARINRVLDVKVRPSEILTALGARTIAVPAVPETKTEEAK